MMTDLGTLNGIVYRTVVHCDEPDCTERHYIDVDTWYIEQFGENAQTSQGQAFMQARAWVTVAAADGSEQHYCAQHAPKVS